MNRFEWDTADLCADECVLVRAENVRLYDGDRRTDFDGGSLTLTDTRLLWSRADHAPRALCLPLRLIVLVESQAHTLVHMGKLLLTLSRDTQTVAPPVSRPVNYSAADFVKLGIRTPSTMQSLHSALMRALADQKWLKVCSRNGNSSVPVVGLLGISRTLEAERRAQTSSIDLAFSDLKQLMTEAGEMVTTARHIAERVLNVSDTSQSPGGQEDASVELRRCLLRLGLDADMSTSSSTDSDLSTELERLLLPAVTAAGGAMSLAEVYCRVNRARALTSGLISPRDLLDACRLMKNLELVGSVLYAAGMEVLERDLRVLRSRDTGLSAHRMADECGVSLHTAKHRLLALEEQTLVCRDESVQGTFFYYNRFLHSA